MEPKIPQYHFIDKKKRNSNFGTKFVKIVYPRNANYMQFFGVFQGSDLSSTVQPVFYHINFKVFG